MSTKREARSVGTSPHGAYQAMIGEAMHRITDCKAFRDYRLWLRFEDGLEGSVYLGNLLEIAAFKGWRDIEQFCQASVDPKVATVVWKSGVELDQDTLYQDLLGSSGSKEFSISGVCPAVG